MSQEADQFMSQEAELLYEGGGAGADIYYASGFLAPDPFALVSCDGRKIGILSDLEIGRAGHEGRMDELVSLKELQDALKAEGNENPRIGDVLERFLCGRGIERLVVPEGFPFGLAERLRAAGLEVACREDPFLPQREIKRPDEIEAIRDNQACTERALGHAIGLVAAAEVGTDRVLLLEGRPLTSERVKYEIAVALLGDELLAGETIVAGGDQGCDPHCRGAGPLYAEQTIILDVFPRSLRNQYWADITRTVYKGKAPDEIHALYEAVAAAQQAALDLLCCGVEGRQVHEAVKAVFADRGYETGKPGGVPQGFIHGTGHGLGLEIHERPRISDVPATLRAGMAVTVEPGLYYPGLGAVRIEDLVVVTETGHENLTTAPKVLEV